MAFSLEPKKTAFLFIEFQNEFTTEGGTLHNSVKPSLDAFNTMVNAPMLLEKARSTECTIIHCPIVFEEGHEELKNAHFGILKDVKDGKAFTAGTWNADFCDSMKPEGNEFIVKGKTGLCSFHSTNLDFILRENKVENVVICGFLANCCVESTMRTAYENRYTVYTVKDACGATSIEEQESCFENNFAMFSIRTNTEEVMSSLGVRRGFGKQRGPLPSSETSISHDVDGDETSEVLYA